MLSSCAALHARGLCSSVFGDAWAEVAAALGRSPCGGGEPPRCRAWQVLNRRMVWDVCRVACKTTWDCDATGGAATSAPVGGGTDTTVVHLAFAADAALLPAVGASIASAVASSRPSTRLHVHLVTTTASLPAAHALRRCLAASLAQHPRLAGGRLRLRVVDFETAPRRFRETLPRHFRDTPHHPPPPRHRRLPRHVHDTPTTRPRHAHEHDTPRHAHGTSTTDPRHIHDRRHAQTRP